MFVNDAYHTICKVINRGFGFDADRSIKRAPANRRVRRHGLSPQTAVVHRHQSLDAENPGSRQTERSQVTFFRLGQA